MAGIVAVKGSDPEPDSEELFRLSDSYVSQILSLLEEGGQHASITTLQTIFWPVKIDVAFAGRWEEVHLKYAKAGDTASSADDSDATVPGCSVEPPFTHAATSGGPGC